MTGYHSCPHGCSGYWMTKRAIGEHLMDYHPTMRSGMTPEQALELYREHCSVGPNAVLERYGEKAAVAAILAAVSAVASHPLPTPSPK